MPAPAPASVRRSPPVGAGPPKKKSFAEIMARAKAAQESKSATLGKITHKPLESSMAKREQVGKPSEARNGSKTAKQDGMRRPGAPGTARSASVGTGTSSRDTNGKSKKAAPVEEVKKIKKAALATTGYTGTARPRPGATPANRNGASSIAVLGGPTPRERSRYRGPLAGPRRRRDEEDDEDLDDFIEYDDEEEEPGYGYGRGGGYDDVDDESDMEAGLTDVEEEERRAERAARLEDKKEAELEARLKREKEERRRREMRMAKR